MKYLRPEAPYMACALVNCAGNADMHAAARETVNRLVDVANNLSRKPKW